MRAMTSPRFEAGITRGLVTAYVRGFGWQLDYRHSGWLPLSFSNGNPRGWRVLLLGRFGCITLGRFA